MEGGINTDATLDYVEFHIFPSQNRYESSVCSSNREENIASGPLDQLLLHSPEIKDLSSKGSTTKFKILPPDSINDAGWFTTATLTRFLHIIGLPDILSIGKEISQLKETRKFQFSLSDKAEVDITTSVESKNELLLAVDLRLTALKEELAAAFNQAIGSKCSPKDISDLGSFALHFGAKDLRDSLKRSVELSTIPLDKDSKNGCISKAVRSAPMPQPSQLDPPIKYSVSPAKVGKIERQSSTDNEDSTFSSEVDEPSVERSRALTRSAMTRRSASPMRRIQIGRSGSRRAAALSIKSLNYFPAREKSSQRDAAGNSSEEEDSERPPKNNVLRMSVQDKISLFESKQRDQGVDIQKTKTSSNVTVGANKAVLRRWSSAMGERAAQCPPDTSTETSSPSSPQNLAPNGKTEPDSNISKTKTCAETAENIKSLLPEKGASEQSGGEADTLEPEGEESCEKHPASIDWSQQKGAELNELFMKLMESKPVRHQNVSDNSKSKNPKEQRGGFYDQHKIKKEENLQGEAAGKRVENEAQIKVMQQSFDERKGKMASTNVSGANRRHAAANEPQKTQKNSTQLINSRTTKPSAVKKPKSKSSPLPATRKSWPLAPSPQATGASPARTPTGPTTTGTTPTNRKPHFAASVVRSSTKVESLQPRTKTLKATQLDANKRINTINEKKQPTATENRKTTKTKVQTPKADTTATAKPSFYNKVTRKSSVVPLETKPFLRKGSGIGPGVGPVVIKTKVVAQPEETLRSSGGLIQAEENKVVTRIDITSQNQEKECETPQNGASIDLEPQLVCPTKCEESQSSNELYASGGDGGGNSRVEVFEIKTETEEELEISPNAWVEIEEHHQYEIIQCKESPIHITSPANVTSPAGFSRPRVRHSLSQMLLEESNEAGIGKWGNTEHPPTMVNQKDAPRGLKRLLKFARKTKADSHLTGWSSPSAFSEGEDDAEESKGQSNSSRFTVQNHRRVQEGHVSASMNTTKATRSFFSLSAFRGNKTNETKLLHH